MFMSYPELRFGWGLIPKNVIHVGAHKAEEWNLYKKWSPERVLWIEAQNELASQLREKFESDPVNVVEEAVIWSESGVPLELKVTNNGESTSLFDMKFHAKLYPGIKVTQTQKVITKTLDEVNGLKLPFDLLNIDIQGGELQALRGGSETLKAVKWLYLEVNNVELYENVDLVESIDSYVLDLGFIRVKTRWWKRDGWGDALYIRSNISLNYNSIFSRLVRLFYDTRWQVLRQFRIVLNR